MELIVIIVGLIMCLLISSSVGVGIYYSQPDVKSDVKSDDVKSDTVKQTQPIVKFTAPIGSCSSDINNGICSDLIGSNKYKASLQGDGNLVIVRSGGDTKWGANSNGGSNAQWKVSNDGVIVVVNNTGVETWRTNNKVNSGVSPYYASLDGVNLVLHDSTGASVWSDPNGG